MKPTIDMDKVQAYLDRQLFSNKCPLCGVYGLYLDIEKAGGLPDFSFKNAMPPLSLCCNNCGYTAFINAMQQGLLKHEGGSNAK